MKYIHCELSNLIGQFECTMLQVYKMFTSVVIINLFLLCVCVCVRTRACVCVCVYSLSPVCAAHTRSCW